MHMADALLSPAVGGTMMAVTIGVMAYSIKKIQSEHEQDDSKIPLMGVMGAFVFAAQMINFSIPGTGSSGHLGGGLMLAVLLGPLAGFITMACVLFIQALFFGDGGLLAYGANVFNMGFFTCFVAYPLIYRPFMKKEITTKRIVIASLITAVVGLQLGAFSVVAETLLSDKTELPFATFLLFMQPIHLAIGLVEGFVTAAVIGYVWNARPELLVCPTCMPEKTSMPMKKILGVLIGCVIIMGAIISVWASSNPDGLEWSIINITGTESLRAGGTVHDFFAKVQEKFSFLPDYQFENGGENSALGTSVAGVLGGFMTLLLVGLIAFIFSQIKKRNRRKNS